MKRLLSALTLSALLLGSSAIRAGPAGGRMASFGTLEPVTPEAARAQAETWFNQAIKDPAQRSTFVIIWENPDRPLLDKVADTLALEPAAAQVLAQARDRQAPAPTALPVILTDPTRPVFYRGNLALAYGKALCLRHVYEEALAALQTANPEDVVDPATYFFHRSVAEHGLMQKDNARRSLNRLLDDVADVPERYKTVGALMLMDLLTWKDKELDAVARLMDNSGRRLALARGGPVTQKIQQDVVNRLDELIKAKENQHKQGSANGGGCPDGSQPGSRRGGEANNPMRDSNPAQNGGPGQVDRKRFKELAQRWGSMSEKERRRILQDLTRGMSDKNAQAIQEYFKRIIDNPPRRR
jgi:hypothetical protein